jgi:hypothetical protein
VELAIVATCGPRRREFGLTLHPSGWVAVDYLLAAHCTVTR